MLGGPSLTRLPAHPQPLPDEIFTHWFMRLAHENQLKGQTLADRLFGRHSSFWARDEDKLASPAVMARIAEQVGKPPKAIWALTLPPYEGVLYLKHNPNGNTRWILPLGVYHRTRRRHGLVYCPSCLVATPVQYFRRRWRLACTTICDVHGNLMHDACYQCGAPVVFYRSELGKRAIHEFDQIARCHACSAELWRAPVWSPPAGDVHALIELRSMLTFHDLGWASCGREVFQYGHQFFDVLHRLCGKLGSARMRPLFEVVAGESHLRGTVVSSDVEFEFRPMHERHHLLLAAIWLLREWPDRFVYACRQAHVTASRLLTEWEVPYWFESVVRERLSGAVYSPPPEEAQAAAAFLARTDAPLSAAKVKRALGRSDIAAALPYRRQRPRVMTDDEAMRFFSMLDRRIANVPPGSAARCLLLRDRAMFLLMRQCGLSEHSVRELSPADAAELVTGKASLAVNLAEYLRTARPFLVRRADSGTLFPSSNGTRLCREALRLRFISHRSQAALAADVVLCEPQHVFVGSAN